MVRGQQLFHRFSWTGLNFPPNLGGMSTGILYQEESYKIIGACFEVYREKGCGFLEAVYQECMEIELRLQGVPYMPKKPLALEYYAPPTSQISFATRKLCWN
jgi:hypothetical protein